MAYFPNGTSYDFFQGDWCNNCKHSIDNGTGSYGCPLTDVHFIYSDKMHESSKRTWVYNMFEILIESDKSYKCTMFIKDDKDRRTIDMFE